MSIVPPHCNISHPLVDEMDECLREKKEIEDQLDRFSTSFSIAPNKTGAKIISGLSQHHHSHLLDEIVIYIILFDGLYPAKLPVTCVLE